MSLNKKVLTEAYRLIQDIGFCKGQLSYRDEDGRALAYDTVGAIDEAAKKMCEGHTYQAIGECLQIFKGTLEDNIEAVWVWNDNPLRMKSEVLSHFISAINSLKE